MLLMEPNRTADLACKAGALPAELSFIESKPLKTEQSKNKLCSLRNIP
jgi:hypothetical protein